MSARTVDDVLAEFASDWHHEFGTTYNSDAMAEHIVKLETRLATLDAERAGVVEALMIAVDLLAHAATSEDGIDAADAAEGVRICRAALTPTTPEASDGE